MLFSGYIIWRSFYLFLVTLYTYVAYIYIYISEQEADAEEERLRKERERQQKQDVMTLGETREQISTLENELAQLKDEKHQLFLQLKKVLNEDDRRRQLIKETRFALFFAVFAKTIFKNKIYKTKFYFSVFLQKF